jgi:hypothetical protein
MQPDAPHALSDFTELSEPSEIWLTPFWFRIFVAGLGGFGAVSASFALTSILLGWTYPSVSGDGAQIIAGTVLAVCLSAIVLRFLNPLNRRRWFRLALSSEGLYLPARDAGLIFIPWSAVVSIDIVRWIVKGGERSAAKLAIDLDEETWLRFKRDAHVEGSGRVRQIRVQIVDVTGDVLAARIKAYRDGSP